MKRAYIFFRHTDIRDAIITLASAIRDISSKLERHEARENLLGDVLKKSISSIDLRTRGSQKNIEGVVKLLASFEKRMDNLESSVLQVSRLSWRALFIFKFLRKISHYWRKTVWFWIRIWRCSSFFPEK